MGYEVNPTSDRWNEIVSIQDEMSQNRAIKKYVYELENRIRRQDMKLRKMREEKKKRKEESLALSIVQDIIREKCLGCNTDWSGTK